MDKVMAVALVLGALVGCGTINGTECKTADEHRCDGSDVAYCEGGKWRTFACRSGCDVIKQECPIESMAKEGAPCPVAKSRAAGICLEDGVATVCSRDSAGDGGAYWQSFPCRACRAGHRPCDFVPTRPDGTCSCN